MANFAVVLEKTQTSQSAWKDLNYSNVRWCYVLLNHWIGKHFIQIGKLTVLKLIIQNFTHPAVIVFKDWIQIFNRNYSFKLTAAYDGF